MTTTASHKNVYPNTINPAGQPLHGQEAGRRSLTALKESPPLAGSASQFINDVLQTVGLQRTTSSLFGSGQDMAGGNAPLQKVGEGVLAFVLLILFCFLISFGLNVFSACKLNAFLADPANSGGSIGARKAAMDLMAAALALMSSPFLNIVLSGVFTHKVRMLVAAATAK